MLKRMTADVIELHGGINIEIDVNDARRRDAIATIRLTDAVVVPGATSDPTDVARSICFMLGNLAHGRGDTEQLRTALLNIARELFPAIDPEQWLADRVRAASWVRTPHPLGHYRPPADPKAEAYHRV